MYYKILCTCLYWINVLKISSTSTQFYAWGNAWIHFPWVGTWSLLVDDDTANFCFNLIINDHFLKFILVMNFNEDVQQDGYIPLFI